MSFLCLIGVAGNTLTLFVLNSFSEMRRQSINVYLTTLAVFDNGVLINAFLMISLPALEKHFHEARIRQELDTNELSISQQFLSNSSLSEDFVDDPIDKLNQDYSDYNSTLLINSSSSYLYSISNSSYSNSSVPAEIPSSEDKSANESPETPIYTMMSYYIVIVYPLALISQTGSAWTTCLITVERYFAVCHPMRIRTLANRTRAIWAVFWVSSSAIFYNIPRFYELKTEDYYGTRVIQQTDLRRDPLYYKFYFIFAYLASMYIIPLSVLSVLNVKIYRAVKRANCSRASLTNQQETELNVASMLVLLVSIFLACNAPAFFVNVLELIDKDHEAFKIGTQVSNLLVCANSSVNFVIYCIFGKKFRENLKQSICWRKKKQRVNYHSRSALPSNSTHIVDGTYV